MIPKIAHFYWGEPVLPFLRVFTLLSFHRHNPDWEIRLYHPARRSEDKLWDSHEHRAMITAPDVRYLLSEIPGLKKIEVNFDPMGLPAGISEIHRSDILRWKLLATDGGLWSDMDIVYFRPITFSLNYRSILCHCPQYGHSVGFLLSVPGNPFFARVYSEALRRLDPKVYQSAGSLVLNHLYPHVDNRNDYNLPMTTIYAYDACHIPEIFQPHPAPENILFRFTPDSIGLHWYAGHPLAAQAVNQITFPPLRNNVLENAIRMSIRGWPDE